MGKKWYVSKTIDFNVIYLAVIGILTKGLGIEIPAELVVSIQTIGNIILRKYFTTEPIA